MAHLKMTKKEISWIVYDVGNSAFVMLSATLIPVYFSSIATGNAMVMWGYAETVSSLIIALVMPFLGSLADLRHMKKKFLVGCVGTGALAITSLGFVGGPQAFLAVYVLAAVTLNASMVFYDALLIDTTTSSRFDEVSSFGYAWGYIGSCIPFLACLFVVLGAETLGIDIVTAMRIAFVITATWWVLFTIPVFTNVHQTHFKQRTKYLFRDAAKGLVRTVRKIWNNKSLRYFMLAYFFYIDGVHTIIKMSTTYGAALGIGDTSLVLALLLTQVIAFPSAIIYGKLSTRYGTKLMLQIGVSAYLGITLFATFFLVSAAQFWMLAVFVGMFQGGIQALSRSEFGKLIPKEHANEYFGFFDIFGKYAAVMGTFLVSSITFIIGVPNLGVVSLCLLFSAGLILLWKMPDQMTTIS